MVHRKRLNNEFVDQCYSSHSIVKVKCDVYSSHKELLHDVGKL